MLSWIEEGRFIPRASRNEKIVCVYCRYEWVGAMDELLGNGQGEMREEHLGKTEQNP